MHAWRLRTAAEESWWRGVRFWGWLIVDVAHCRGDVHQINALAGHFVFRHIILKRRYFDRLHVPRTATLIRQRLGIPHICSGASRPYRLAQSISEQLLSLKIALIFYITCSARLVVLQYLVQFQPVRRGGVYLVCCIPGYTSRHLGTPEF
jgi:hypothetical protein